MRIFSGIQPTGRKHLGNYIGAITQYVAGQDRGEAIYCIVDLHAITVAYEPARAARVGVRHRGDLLAAGLDPERCIFFRQSDVHEHTELYWLLSSVTAYGDLNRMTQFKDKVGRPARPRLGRAVLLPGADGRGRARLPRPRGAGRRGPAPARRADARRRRALQRPLRRDAASSPRRRIPEVGRADHGPPAPRPEDVDHRRQRAGHRATCTTSPTRSLKKFRSSVTDSGREVVRAPDKPGISNLIEILAAVRGDAPERGRGRVRRRGLRRRSRRPWPRRSSSYLAPVRERYQALRGDERGARADPRRGRREGARDRLRDAGRGPRRRWASDRSAAPGSLPGDAPRRPRARPRRVRGSVRPAADADPARGGRSARGRPRRGRDLATSITSSGAASSTSRRRPSSSS